VTHDDEQSSRDWQVALLTTLSDAIEHLQVLIFEEGWDALLAETGGHEAALRESVAIYERELARLFGFLRASGALLDAVAWSTLKTDLRRAALDSETEISLRTALESGLYVAESIPLGDHARYLRWSAALRGFLVARASGSSSRPSPDADDDDRLRWAYSTLAAIEDHDAFSAAFIAWLDAESSDPSTAGDLLDLQTRLLALPRFDIVLNTSLRWLAASANS
jgi:hypothetical protein